MESKMRRLVIIRGKGTAREARIETNIIQHFVPEFGRWVTVPEEN